MSDKMERAMERQRERLYPEPDSDYQTENPLCEHGKPQYNCGAVRHVDAIRGMGKEIDHD